MGLNTKLASGLLAFAVASATWAGGPQSWNVDETTTGGDVEWVSPAPVDPDAAFYLSTFEITLIEVQVPVFGFIDVTDQAPPGSLITTACVAGPAPFTLSQQAVVFPEPPEPPSVAGDLVTGIRADGFVFFSGTNIVLGTIDVGILTVPIQALRIAGTITLEPFGDAACPADLDEDGSVGFSDLLQVIGAWGLNECDRADLDFSGDVGFSDVLAVISAWGPCL